ncbi:MAG: hypothetical protein C0600_16485, partial [Ignavibacteria bacterium]
MTPSNFALLISLSFGALMVFPESASQNRPSTDKPEVRLKEGNVHFNDRFSLNLQRTLRIPDDGRQYPL